MIERMEPTPAASPEPKPHAYADALDDVRLLIARTLGKADPMLTDVMSHLSGGQGKNLRAALLLAASTDSQGLAPADAVTAAAALEILHLATLVHDDIIDEAPTRRGQPSIQSKFGKKTAVIGGDYLFCLCFDLIAGISAPYAGKYGEFTRAMTSLCIGELSQHKHNKDVGLSVPGYLRIIAGKTAALFTLALYSGAVLGGASESDCRLLGRAGYNIGMLFQLMDDCLDYEANPETLKKSVNHDLAEGVITLPLIYAFRGNGNLRQIVAGRSLAAGDIRAIVAEVVSLGGVAKTKDMIERYNQKTCRLLDRLDDPDKRGRIIDLLNVIRVRQH